jgi:uncharacterized metal-binding protein
MTGAYHRRRGGRLPGGPGAYPRPGRRPGQYFTPHRKTFRRISHRLCLAPFLVPYSRIMPHRSWWSHMPIFSTFFRVAYLFALPALLWGLAGIIID